MRPSWKRRYLALESLIENKLHDEDYLDLFSTKEALQHILRGAKKLRGQ